MKAFEETCEDCPSRELAPDIITLLQYLDTNHPTIMVQARENGFSPMIAAIKIMEEQNGLV